MTDLPPRDQQQTWIVVHGNEQAGPYGLDLLIDEVVAGRLPENTPVWWPSLPDWTTMSVHPAIAAEIARRRSASTTNWLAPESPSVFSQPQGPGSLQAGAPQGTESAPQAVQPDSALYAAQPDTGQAVTAQPVVENVDPGLTGQGVTGDELLDNGTIVDDTVAEAAIVDVGSDSDVADESELADGDIADAEIVRDAAVAGDSAADDAAVTDSVGSEPGAVEPVAQPVVQAPDQILSVLEGSVRADFAALVSRSATRADLLAKVSVVDEAFVSATIAAALGSGFVLEERVDVDRGHEMRFNDSSGSQMLVISLGQVSTSTPDEIRSAVLPVTISIRTDQPLTAAQRPEVTGQHGQVVVNPDDWTGKTTGSVALYLGADDYVDESLVVDEGLIQRDIRSAVETVRSALI